MREGTFTTRDGTSLFERRWIAPDARGAVALVHGYGHHCGSFGEFAERLNAVGYSVYGFDQRGHGKSPGTRGAIPRFETTLDDLGAYLDYLRLDTGDLPLYAMGHSLGALVLGLHVIDTRALLAGLIFSSGLLRIPDSVSPLLRRLVRMLGMLAPWAPVQRVDYRATSRDPEALAASMADPLVLSGVMRARTAAEIAMALSRYESRMDEITLPALILHGTADRLTDYAGSAALYTQARSADKTLLTFDGAYHELYNDFDKARFFSAIIAWLNARAL